jgi:tetratricopeptide (TPR) repeat protein
MLGWPIRIASSRLLLGFSAFAFACASGPTVHEREWIEVSTPNFQIMSTMSPEKASKLAIDLERFRVIVARFTNASMSDSPIATKIFAFEKKGDFQRFTRSSNVAGWISAGMRNNVIALADQRGMDSSQIIRHEYIHFILNNATTIQYPTWYNEGFAEYMSTFEIRKDRELVIGSAQRERVQVLNWAPWIPLRRIITARGLDGFHDETEVGVFYAEAWALVHYLQQGRGGHHNVSAELDRYIELIEGGSSDEDAFEEAFGVTISIANHDLKIYLKHRIQAIVFALSALNFEPPEPNIQSMSPDQISAQLGQLSLTRRNGPDAQVYFEAAIAANPENARAHAGLGDALKFQGLWSEAEPHFNRAVELDPDDELNYLDLAEYFHDKAKEDAFEGDRAELLKAARREYVKSQKREPSLPETYAMYGSTYLEPGQDHARALKGLEHANSLLPSNTDILLMLAKAYALNDRDDEARELVERYVAWSHSKQRGDAVAEILAELNGDTAEASEVSAPN